MNNILKLFINQQKYPGYDDQFVNLQLAVNHFEKSMVETQSYLEQKVKDYSESLSKKFIDLQANMEKYNSEVKYQFANVSTLFTEKSKEWVQNKFGDYEHQEKYFQYEVTNLKADLEMLKDVDQTNKECRKLSGLIENTFNRYK